MNTNIDTITIPVRLDAITFRSFAIFDMLKRQKRWKSPAIFVAILMASAIVCFAMNPRADQVVLFGSMLTAITLGLPVAYFGMFFYSLDNQVKAMKLNATRLVYTVELSGRDDGIRVTNASGEGQTAQSHRKNSFAAYRAADCIYLYVSPRQAFLLPGEQANVMADELWDYLNAHMAAEEMYDCRKR